MSVQVIDLFNYTMSEDDTLKIFSNVRAAANGSHKKTSYKGMLRDLKLLCTRSYKLSAAFRDSSEPKKWCIVNLDTNAGPNFIQK